jgi:hypothetical protein
MGDLVVAVHDSPLAVAVSGHINRRERLLAMLDVQVSPVIFLLRVHSSDGLACQRNTRNNLRLSAFVHRGIHGIRHPGLSDGGEDQGQNEAGRLCDPGVQGSRQFIVHNFHLECGRTSR